MSVSRIEFCKIPLVGLMNDRSLMTWSTGSFYQLMIIKYYNTETLLYSLIIFVSDIERSLKIVFLSIIRQTEAIRA